MQAASNSPSGYARPLLSWHPGSRRDTPVLWHQCSGVSEFVFAGTWTLSCRTCMWTWFDQTYLLSYDWALPVQTATCIVCSLRCLQAIVRCKHDRILAYSCRIGQLLWLHACRSCRHTARRIYVQQVSHHPLLAFPFMSCLRYSLWANSQLHRQTSASSPCCPPQAMAHHPRFFRSPVNPELCCLLAETLYTCAMVHQLLMQVSICQCRLQI